jgi:hypothetical protein
MVGSHCAAEAANGKGTARRRGSLRRFLYAGAALALLAACSTAEPEPPTAALSLPAAPSTLVVAQPPAKQALTGLSAKEVVTLLGEPDFRRAEPPAELWQYRSADCVLDLFFYSDEAGTHVVRAETRDRSLVQAGAGRCTGASEPISGRTRQTRL